MADNIHHNTQTLDALNTFHGMGMIKTITPGIKCTPRIIPCEEVTVEDVAVAKIVSIIRKYHNHKPQTTPKLTFTFTRMLKGSILNMKNFQKLAKLIILGTLIYFGSNHICFTLQLQLGMVLWFIMGNILVNLQ